MNTPTTPRTALALLALLALVLPNAVAATASAAPPPGRTKHLYVAPDGSGHRCHQRVPCSLDGARDRIADIHRMGGDVVVTLAGGTYRRQQPLRLGPEHSGRDGHTVTWRAAEGETPILSGGVDLDGWTPAAQQGVWTAAVPDGLAPRQLYVDGTRAVRAQGPTCDRVTECWWTEQGLQGPAAQRYADLAKPEDLEFSFRVRWRNYRCGVDVIDGDLIRMEQPCWVNSSTAKHRMPYNWGTTTLDGSRYDGPVIVENAREFVDEPGEFYVDTDTDTAYYLPRPGQDMSTARAAAPSTETLLRLDDASNVAIEGLTFAHTGWEQPSTPDGYSGAQAGFTITGEDGPDDLAGEHFTRQAAAVEIISGDRVTVSGSSFEHLGAAGVDVHGASKHTTITANTFHDLSGGAVYVGDTDPDAVGAEVSQNNEVSDNHIEDIGVEFTDSVGIWGGYERETVFDHNTIQDVPYSAISLGWGWTAVHENPMRDNRITDNRLVDVMGHDVGMHDGAGIYTQGVQPGTVISGNYINRVEYPDRDPALDGNGVYMDERSSYITVTDNVITRIGGKWVSNWASYGRYNHAYGNWADLVSPALSGEGSIKEDNAEGLTRLPQEAIVVARDAGADSAGVVEQLLEVTSGLPTEDGTQVTVTVPNTTDHAYTGVEVSLTAPDGWSTGPTQTVGAVAPHDEARLTFTVVAPDGADTAARVEAHATYTVAGVGPGLASGAGTVDTAAALASFAAAFNIVATTDDATPAAGTFTDSGRSYSAQALAAEGITPGATVTHDGSDFSWPAAAPGELNAVFADGQTFRLSGRGSTLAFAGASAYGDHSGDGVVYYTDGTAQPFTLSLPDWFHADSGDPIAVMSYSNSGGGRFSEDAAVFYDAVPLDSTKTVGAVRLPDSGTPSGAGIRLLAVGIG